MTGRETLLKPPHKINSKHHSHHKRRSVVQPARCRETSCCQSLHTHGQVPDNHSSTILKRDNLNRVELIQFTKLSEQTKPTSSLLIKISFRTRIFINTIYVKKSFVITPFLFIAKAHCYLSLNDNDYHLNQPHLELPT